jgi:hypothetical protein
LAVLRRATDADPAGGLRRARVRLDERAPAAQTEQREPKTE